jgi:hypothetical protein
MITLTKEQAQIVLRSLDLAVRQLGLEGAAAALPIAESIKQQLESKDEHES